MATNQTRRNKNNGQSAQKNTCNDIKEIYPDFVVLSPLDDFDTVMTIATVNGKKFLSSPVAKIKPRCMGLPGEDILMNYAARCELPASIEVKYGLGYTKVQDAMAQAVTNASKGTIPVVVLNPTGKRGKKTKRLAVCEWKTLLRLIKDQTKLIELEAGL